MEFLTIPSELGCYLGVSTSFFIVSRLLKMKKLNFVNQMFLIFYVVDSLLGLLEVFFLFNLSESVR